MVKIAPSILSANSAFLCDEVKLLQKANADYIHFDVMDGHFVNNMTFGPKILKDIRSCADIEFDVHLMVDDPIKFIPWYAEAGADILTFHLEAIDNPTSAIKLINKHGIKAGISIKPQTSIDKLLPYIDMVDLVLIMSVEPGFGGQKFMDSSIDKIAKIKKIINPNKTVIEVDGGINEQTAKLCINAGADILVAGTSVFKNNNYEKNIRTLKGE